MAMESINEILKRSQVTNQPEPLTDSRDQRKTETLIVKCEICGQERQAYQITDRYGKVFPPLKKCSSCMENERREIYFKEAQAKLPEETEKTRQKWYDEISFPGVFIEKVFDKEFDSFDRNLQSKAYDAIKNYDGHSIILSSPEVYGVGKTHLVCILAHHLLETAEACTLMKDGTIRHRKCPVQFITETNLLAKIRASYNYNGDFDHETEEEIYNRFEKYETLIIDDVGKVRPRDLSFLQGVYFRIIDQRYTDEKSIIITTNLSPQDLEKHIGGACADRLKEMCGSSSNIITMIGKSYRDFDKKDSL